MDTSLRINFGEIEVEQKNNLSIQKLPLVKLTSTIRSLNLGKTYKKRYCLKGSFKLDLKISYNFTNVNYYEVNPLFGTQKWVQIRFYSRNFVIKVVFKIQFEYSLIT